MKKALPEIRESAFELEQLLRTEKRFRGRERLHMLYLEFLGCRQISGVLRLNNPVMIRVYGLPYGELAGNL